MSNSSPEGEDRLARLLSEGPAAVEKAEKELRWIELRGGPLEGQTAPEGQGARVPELRFMHLPDSGPPRGTQPMLQTLVYVRQHELRYLHRETLEQPISSAEYEEIKEAEGVLDQLRKLITDQRLTDSPSPDAGCPDPLPLEGARRFKRRGVARFRREMREIGRDHVALLSDEQVWAFVRGTMQADLEWAALGSVLHHKGMLVVARDRFGLAVPEATP